MPWDVPWEEMGWGGMWNGMGRGGVGCSGVEWDGMGCEGVGWGRVGLELGLKLPRAKNDPTDVQGVRLGFRARSCVSFVSGTNGRNRHYSGKRRVMCEVMYETCVLCVVFVVCDVPRLACCSTLHIPSSASLETGHRMPLSAPYPRISVRTVVTS